MGVGDKAAVCPSLCAGRNPIPHLTSPLKGVERNCPGAVDRADHRKPVMDGRAQTGAVGHANSVGVALGVVP